MPVGRERNGRPELKEHQGRPHSMEGYSMAARGQQLTGRQLWEHQQPHWQKSMVQCLCLTPRVETRFLAEDLSGDDRI